MNRCINIAAENKGIHPMMQEFRPVKNQLRDLITHCFIDKGMTKDEVIEAIRNRIVKQSIEI